MFFEEREYGISEKSFYLCDHSFYFRIKVGKFSIYNIPLKSLVEGVHTFDYVLDDHYFTLIRDTDSDILRGNVIGKVEVKRITSTFELSFSLHGVVSVPCDRCLDDISMDVNSENRLFVKFGHEYLEESDEIVIIPEEEGEINIAWFLYEFIALSLPMKKVHPPGKCNRAMSSKLNRHKAVVANNESDDDDIDADEPENDVDMDKETDPRWDVLKGLADED